MGEVLDAGHGDTYPVEVLDMSDTGCRFRAARELPVESRVQLKIDFYPVDFPIHAKVVWVKRPEDGQYEHGAHFVDMAPEEAYLISHHLKEMLKSARRSR
jgi:hypothetical protein